MSGLERRIYQRWKAFTDFFLLFLRLIVEEVNPQDKGLLTGRLESGGVVHFPGDPKLIGTIINVRLDEAKGFYYLGRGV